MDGIQSKRDRSINFGFIGLGQGGSRLATTFKKYGYKVLAINTSRQDLDGLQLDEEFKLAIADDGAGKDMPKGARAVKERVAMIRSKIESTFPEHFKRSTAPQRIILCAGSGGGTGAGALAEMVDVLEYLNFSGKIGVLLALPQDTEDSKAKQNTIDVFKQLIPLSNEEKIAPLIVIDNAKIRQKFPGISADTFWERANEEIAKIFHFFNLLTFRGSTYTSLDPADYLKIMKMNGFTIFGRSNLPENELNKTALKQAIDLQISQNRSLLADGFDVFRAQKVGCLVVAKPETMRKIPMDLLESGFAHIHNRIKGGTIFKGVYAFDGVKTNGLELMTIWAGMDSPSRRIIQLNKESKEERIIIEKKVEATSVENILKDLDDSE